MRTPEAHSTRRTIRDPFYTQTLFAAGRIPARSSQAQHESDVTPYVPRCLLRYDADSDTALPMRVQECE